MNESIQVGIVAADAIRIKSKPAHITNYSPITRVPTLVVIHATHGAEGPNKDDDEALAISRPGQKKSFHYVVDSDSATRCVADNRVAWHCGKTGNRRGIGIEICGSANQTRSQWLDRVSLATLNIAARLVADLCLTHKIPPVLVKPASLLIGQWGITTHGFVTEAFKESTHWDPGPGFPLDEFVSAVTRAMNVV